MAKKMNTLEWVALILVLVGGLNWGLVAIGYNLVNLLLGAVPVLEKTVYGLVGVSSLYMIYSAAKK